MWVAHVVSNVFFHVLLLCYRLGPLDGRLELCGARLVEIGSAPVCNLLFFQVNWRCLPVHPEDQRGKAAAASVSGNKTLEAGKRLSKLRFVLSNLTGLDQRVAVGTLIWLS